MERLLKQHRIVVLKYLALRAKQGKSYESFCLSQTLRGIGRADNRQNRAAVAQFWKAMCPDMGDIGRLPDAELRNQLLMRHKRMFQEVGQ